MQQTTAISFSPNPKNQLTPRDLPPKALSTFTSTVTSEFFGTEQNKCHPNFLTSEMKGLERQIELQNAGEVMMLSTDKTGGFAYFDSSDNIFGINKILYGSFVATDGTKLHYFRQVKEEEITDIQKQISEYIMIGYSTQEKYQNKRGTANKCLPYKSIDKQP